MTNPTLQATHTQPSRSRDQRALSRSTVLALVGIALLVAGPWIFDSYVLNLLIKAFLFAIVVITVDVLWGYTGYLTFGQSAFFGIGAYAAGLVFTHFGLSPATIAIAIGLAIIVPMGVAALVGWLSFYRGASPFFATVISLVLPIVMTQLLLSGGEWTGSSSGLTGYAGSLVLDRRWWCRADRCVRVAVRAQ